MVYDINRFSNNKHLTAPLLGNNSNNNNNTNIAPPLYMPPPVLCGNGNINRQPSQPSQPSQPLRPCLPQEHAPVYGPPGEASQFTSYPVRARFENRKKWTEHDVAQTERRPTPVKLGCGIISNGEDQYEHRFTNFNRAPSQGEPNEILISTPPTMQKYPHGEYNDELFKTRIDNTENKVSTGVMVNPYTGEMFETFIDEIPPPNTNKHIPREQFLKSNPMLIKSHGGIDPNAPRRQKREICKKIPGPEHGPNVWGDALYTGRIGDMQRELIGRDIFNNRNGDYSTDRSLIGEKPAGYVGLHQMFRPRPYLPPTQQLDTKGWKPSTDKQFPDAGNIKSKVFVRRPDLTTFPYTPHVHTAGGDHHEAGHVVSGNLDLRPTMRGDRRTEYTAPAHIENIHEAIEPLQKTLRPTLKEQMEQSFDVLNAQPNIPEQAHVIIDTTLRPTLKEQMEQGFEPLNAQPNIPEQAHVIIDTTLRPTLKEQMEQSFDALNAQPNIPEQAHVIIDKTLRPTLKEQMEQSFDTLNFEDAGGDNNGNSGGYIDFQGDIQQTKRQFYELLPGVGRPAELTIGDSVGVTSELTSKQHRGNIETNYVQLSGVVQEVEDPSIRVVGHYDRESKRQLKPAHVVPELSVYENYRWIPEQHSSCQSDILECNFSSLNPLNYPVNDNIA